MKFGAREICDVVLKAKVDGQKIGTNVYKKGQPIMYFDSLKTTSIEQATTPVYAQGGKGNTKLISWEGEKTITFVMEDALLSPISFAILTKAGLSTARDDKENGGLVVHVQGRFKIETPTGLVKDEETGKVTGFDNITSVKIKDPSKIQTAIATKDMWAACIAGSDFVPMEKVKTIVKETGIVTLVDGAKFKFDTLETDEEKLAFYNDPVIFLDYYALNTDVDSTLITIEPETFEGNYYLEASTLFRTTSGVDLPAEFIIPNCKPQSAMTLALASTGDPSTFTFTMDVYPDYTVYDQTKKVLAAIQILDNEGAVKETGTGYTQF